MSQFPPGRKLGPYEIVSPLGAGGMGEVYRALDARLGRYVAIKVLPEHLSASPDLRARFEREARTLSQLNHPAICTLHDVGHDSGIDYLVMELIDGETLAARLIHGPLPIEQLLSLAEQITAALIEAHRAGLVHRDLKPANLMLTASGVKLLDFGLARPGGTPTGSSHTDSQAPTQHSPLTNAGAIVGTFQYMAPEQLEGREADARSDLFALGCVLYEMATGRRPFRGTDSVTILGSILRDRPETPSLVNPLLPQALGRVIARCLEKEPEARYASADELRDALVRLRRWASDEAIPELAAICERILVVEESADSWNAFRLAQEIEKLAPNHPMLERIRPDFSLPVTIVSDPPGASVFATFYGQPADEPIELGVTPLEGIAYPRGLTRLRLDLEGYSPAHDVVLLLGKGLSNAMVAETPAWSYTLHAPGAIPDGMVPVPAGGFPLYMPGFDHLDTEPTSAFLVDRDPVTNRQFKRFVDAGGYAREEYWREPFRDGDDELSRIRAMSRFTDSVGQPGPSNWEMGDFPAGEQDHPVSGVSWYEAAAYAVWAGKSLPTIFHWNRVAFPFATSQISPLANLSGRHTVPVGSTSSWNRFGARDLAGNVREWVRNPVDRPGHRFILGGGWIDPTYSFVDAYAQSSFDRSSSNGFRCILETESDSNLEQLSRMLAFPFRDFRAEQPVPDEVFRYFLSQFTYDRTPLHAVLIADQPLGTGRWQTIEIDAAYGRERMQIHVFLPGRGTPPLQTVVLFPGSQALHTRTFGLAEFKRVDFLVKSGRAVVLPIYQSTFERGGAVSSDYPEMTALYKEHVIMWGKDLARAIDYLETRDDLDLDRLAYLGTSWGGALGAILPAIERRIRANILYVAGFCFQRALPEADQINYVSRVLQPTLMLNGELDFFFPAETSQIPMFEMLGTPAEHKKRLTFPRGHTVPKPDLITESLAWLDRYLGPVSQ